eukprot:1553635-Heterocapsa_arctica.AAC.1
MSKAASLLPSLPGLRKRHRPNSGWISGRQTAPGRPRDKSTHGRHRIQDNQQNRGGEGERGQEQ